MLFRAAMFERDSSLHAFHQRDRCDVWSEHATFPELVASLDIMGGDA